MVNLDKFCHALCMSLVLSTLMSGWVTFINIGWVDELGAAWLKAFLLAWPAAFAISLFMGTPISKVSTRLSGLLRRHKV
ncbi:DUF2798 domain-containing protein [Alteromonas sp. ASW11-130]|uniref:DUF2798 domain-containing protein n=1 Tax=Alteromonas sp. ASW11-130 TaxID=3015775 RepID=UPI002242B1AF|nr:DUF2798 domain-containing protein [Alteromonas sp. ASW11-130]MCW8093442.1 DUF2798 domain-containing protein [Alteromonas sp. ASW11-130]